VTKKQKEYDACFFASVLFRPSHFLRTEICRRMGFFTTPDENGL